MNNADTKLVHLFFNRLIKDNYYPDLEDKEKFLKNASRQVVLCSGWDDLSEKLKLNPQTICFFVNELDHISAFDIVSMVKTLSKLIGITHTITITVGIKKSTPYSLVKELQKSEIFGIIPSYIDFGFKETLYALECQWNGIHYWPKHIIQHLPGAPKLVKKSKKQTGLTVRQNQIIHLIKERGLSNKLVAKTLNISESAVKAQLTQVYKKTGIRTRAQLISFGTPV